MNPESAAESGPNLGSPQTRPTRGHSQRFLWLGVAAVLAAADLAIKGLVENRLADGQIIDFGIINIRLGYNTGVAFGMGDAFPPWVIVVITGIITAFLAGYLLHEASAHRPRLYLIGLMTVLGGALGNLVDRADGAGVVDYLHTGWFPTFNLADVFITLGAATVAISVLLNGPKKPKP
ncbi:signal peptidase II [Arthrobacter sp. AET 35A]|uniref:signal peptidase II n=1 Tax=Arthrobacter sp. AET 35A TaxID=2292643 RepID=UPI001784B121|nr:signal peptidase II [Arthrobacter sp. AET 35A]MBE0011018.1 signal peptidase II [Arthrobacter sp. AET 35A]